VDVVNRLPVIVSIQFSRDFKEQTGDWNSHKNQGSSISFRETPKIASNLTPRNGNKFVSRQRKPPKYLDSIAQFLNSKKTVATAQKCCYGTIRNDFNRD
jgi:hypothetical protein